MEPTKERIIALQRELQRQERVVLFTLLIMLALSLIVSVALYIWA